ncbi:Zinc ABC transporter, periplasmic-binding protein ZnuA [Methanosarcina sp. MTP4]|uniref:metal ABC transporter solute-binding protein, Zn/Mn family n=1 Tax=Methanosarcina sp. MTP4 TaxID=1434100 RepID=UPI000615D41B|nr:zinc ABC transporter substrate-binding protein [Methanosarcina sp. MTP4]AKB26700.1 Zinc ABC transporter, periplasmic-binding protein ZnuA [Methanosarcina sp. MTP4]
MKLKILPILVLLVVGFSLFASGCADTAPENNSAGQGAETGEDEEPIVVAVSILPQAEFVEKVGGNKVKVIVMIPPGASPATHEPSPGQLRDVSEARMYATVGSGLPFEEVWMDKIEAVNSEFLIVDCSEGVELREIAAHNHYDELEGRIVEEDAGVDAGEREAEEDVEHEVESEAESHVGMDPHIWTSPVNAKIMVENIYTGLVEIDPENEAYYAENRDSYLEELDALDARIREKLEGKEGRSFMVFHPSWGYFAAEYGLTMIPIEIEGKEPSVQDLARLISDAKEKDVKVIFVQAQFSTRSADAIAEEIGGEVVVVDPLAKDYVSNMDEVSDIFARNLV